MMSLRAAALALQRREERSQHLRRTPHRPDVLSGVQV